MTRPPKIPVLCAGDTLSRDEFERRYEAMPDVEKAELLEGVVYMPSPVRHSVHGRPHSLLAGWLRDYARATPGTDTSLAPSVRLADTSEPQPDLILFVAPPHGQLRLAADGYLEGAPELAVEVAASSVSYDLHAKRRAYECAGVCEYLVLRVEVTRVTHP